MSIPVDGTGAHGRSPMISWPGVDACTACVGGWQILWIIKEVVLAADIR